VSQGENRAVILAFVVAVLCVSVLVLVRYVVDEMNEVLESRISERTDA
jgi:hypothetical protein